MADIFVDSGGGAASSPFANWTDAAATLAAALAVATAADTIYVANTHSETAGAAITLTLPTTHGLRILSVTPSGATGNSGLTAGASVAVGAASAALSFQNRGYIYGISFTSGTNTSSACVMNFHALTANGGSLFFEACDFSIPTANTSVAFNLGIAGGSTDDIFLQYRGCSFKFGTTSHTIRAANCRFIMEDMRLSAAGSIPTTLFSTQAGSAMAIGLIESSDLSTRAFTNWWSVSNASPTFFRVRDTKVSGTPALTTGTSPGIGGVWVELHNVDSGDTREGFGFGNYAGTIVEETTLVRSGGGTVSYRFDDAGTTKFPNVALTMEGSIYNSTTGSAQTLTVPILHDSATNLQNDEIWVEILHLGTSGSCYSTLVVADRAADVLASPADQTTDSGSSWTTTGMSNPNKQSLSASFTAQEAGYVHFRVCVTKAASYTVYVDMEGASVA